jgi:ArsR family transcriptional regulator, virulence genes transcriptional regulator
MVAMNIEEIKLSAQRNAQFFKLIANSNRLMILRLLSVGEASVGELEQQMGVSQPALSQHLARMRQEDILEAKRSGQQIFYSIKDLRILMSYCWIDFSSKHASP